MPKPIIKISTKTVRELRDIAKDQGRHGYYKLQKTDPIALSSGESTEETPQQKGKANKRRPVPLLKIILTPPEMDEFEKEKRAISRPVVKKKLNDWYDWLVDYVPKSIKNPVSKAFSRAKNTILKFHDDTKKALNVDVEDAAERENQEVVNGNINLTPHENERAFKRAFRSSEIARAPKTDIDSYFDQIKPHIKALIEKQLKEMASAKVIMTLWVRWKKPVESLIKLHPEDAENAQGISGSTGDNSTMMEMPFNILMTEFFQGSDINELIQRMTAHRSRRQLNILGCLRVVLRTIK